MSSQIHPSAIVDERSDLGTDVDVGPFAIVGPGVEIGDGTRLAARAIIEKNTTIGNGCYIGSGSIIGGDPQDLKFRGEETRVHIGDFTKIREYSTVNCGTAAAGETVIGSRCFIMTYVHIAHDCVLEDDVTLANAVQLGGHVHIARYATVGGLTPVHQFVRIGEYAFVGGGSRVPQDVPPYARAAGNPIRLFGINGVGLERAGFDREKQDALKYAYRSLFNSGLTTGEAIERLRNERVGVAEVLHLIDFVESSDRGITTARVTSGGTAQPVH